MESWRNGGKGAKNELSPKVMCVQLETNCAGLAAHAAEREAIRLLAREVKAAFR